MKNHTIDVVITWVDGNDETWKKNRQKWLCEFGLNIRTEERYRDWKNLHYIFRGIEKFMPWVNHVFLVTDNQRPVWLDTDYEKITIIDHLDIIPSNFLPTFSSRAIEMNLHNIKGLSNNFIYFNDDMFIIKSTKKEDFFINGIPRETAIAMPKIPKSNFSWGKNLYNDISLINEVFNYRETFKGSIRNWLDIEIGKHMLNNLLMFRWNKFSDLYINHLPTSYNKETFSSVWNKFDKELTKTVKNKFRNNEDNTIHLFKFWQIASNKFKQRRKSFGKLISIQDERSIQDCLKCLLEQKYYLICINDNEKTQNFEETRDLINLGLNRLLPDKSNFEI